MWVFFLILSQVFSPGSSVMSQQDTCLFIHYTASSNTIHFISNCFSWFCEWRYSHNKVWTIAYEKNKESSYFVESSALEIWYYTVWDRCCIYRYDVSRLFIVRFQTQYNDDSSHKPTSCLHIYQLPSGRNLQYYTSSVFSMIPLYWFKDIYICGTTTYDQRTLKMINTLYEI